MQIIVTSITTLVITDQRPSYFVKLKFDKTFLRHITFQNCFEVPSVPVLVSKKNLYISLKQKLLVGSNTFDAAIENEMYSPFLDKNNCILMYFPLFLQTHMMRRQMVTHTVILTKMNHRPRQHGRKGQQPEVATTNITKVSWPVWPLVLPRAHLSF